MDGVSMFSGMSGSIDFSQMRKDKFDSGDSDGDGKLSLAEFESARPTDAPAGAPDASEIFAQMDADGDGYVTQGEVDAAAANMQAQMSSMGGVGGMMGGDMLSTLLDALQEEEDGPETTEASTSSDDDEDEATTSSLEDNTLEMIAEQLVQYRSVTGAYENAQDLQSVFGPTTTNSA